LTIDLEEPEEITAFLDWLKFQSKRLSCLEKDVFTKLAIEYKTQMKEGLAIEPRINSKTKKKT